MRIPGLTGIGLRSWRRCWALSALACLASVPQIVFAQIGPVDATGYLEYRSVKQSGNAARSITRNELLARTDWSTFVWRPWVLGVDGNFTVSQEQSAINSGSSRSGRLSGALNLNFLPRSSFPLRLFYSRSDFGTDRQDGVSEYLAERFGLAQQLRTTRFGNYSFRWEDFSARSLYLNGFDRAAQNHARSWQLTARKSLGASVFDYSSKSLLLERGSQANDQHSLRHSLRHVLRPNRDWSLSNTVFLAEEQTLGGDWSSLNVYRQLSSIATWRPPNARNLILTGRGFLQDTESSVGSRVGSSKRYVLNGTALYRFSDQLQFNAALGLGAGQSDGGAHENAVQQLGLVYRSRGISVFDGNYQYYAQSFVANNSEGSENGDDAESVVGTTLGHSYSSDFISAGKSRWTFRLAQNVMTRHDTSGYERNALQNTVSFGNSAGRGDLTRHLRLSLTDRRSYADEFGDYQLANLQYSVHRVLSSRRSWTANASVQYGRRESGRGPFDSGGTTNLSYSISAAYSDSHFLNINNLRFTSNLQWSTSDFQSSDPIGVESVLERTRIDSYWRSRLEYRIGLLQVSAHANVFERDGALSTSFSLSARRYFGMR